MVDPSRPCIIRYGETATHQDLARLQSSTVYATDPDALFYVRENPDFADGDVLCALLPLDFADISSMFISQMRRNKPAIR